MFSASIVSSVTYIYNSVSVINAFLTSPYTVINFLFLYYYYDCDIIFYVWYVLYNIIYFFISKPNRIDGKDSIRSIRFI